jgi:hypothetical protein
MARSNFETGRKPRTVRAAKAMKTSRRPHPPCADGEGVGELNATNRHVSDDPIQLAWMVKEFLPL